MRKIPDGERKRMKRILFLSEICCRCVLLMWAKVKKFRERTLTGRILTPLPGQE
jgi:hypothetical protein